MTTKELIEIIKSVFEYLELEQIIDEYEEKMKEIDESGKGHQRTS